MVARIVIYAALALAFVHLCIGGVPTVQLLDYATSGSSLPDFPDCPSLNAAGGKYIFVYDLNSGGRVIVFERDSQGTYTTLIYQMAWTRQPSYITTNGNWFGALSQGYIDTFQLSPTGTFENITSFASSTAQFIQFMNDNTLVVLTQSSIDTYEFKSSGGWTTIYNQPVNFTVTPYLTLTNGGNSSDSVPHVTDTTLAAFNPILDVVELYTRNADKSWTLVDGITLDTTQYHANRIIWNGDDTAVIGDTSYKDSVNPSSQGAVLIFVKNAGVWNMTQLVPSYQYLSTTPGYLGFSMQLIDRNLIAIGAPGDTSNLATGSVLYLQRFGTGDWHVTLEFIGQSATVLFGFSVMQNDFEVIVQTFSVNADNSTLAQQVVIPPCYLPMKYACLNLTLDTCQTNNIPYDQLYTVGDNCTVVNVTETRVDGANTTVTFSFSRNYSDTFYCNATVTCTSPPAASPITSPPLSAPMTPVSPPVAAPVSTPVATTPVSPPITPPAPSTLYKWTLQLQNNAYTSYDPSVHVQTGQMYLNNVVASGKYIMTSHWEDISSVVLERDSFGNYSTSYSKSGLAYCLATNGNWFGTVWANMINFQLGPNGTLTNTTSYPTPMSPLYTFARYMSDNSLVWVSTTNIWTYEFQAINGTWANSLTQPVNFTVLTRLGITGAIASVPHLTDTTLAAFNPTTNFVELYTRNANKTWSLIDAVPVNTSLFHANNIVWTGDDTVILLDTAFQETSGTGQLLIFTKTNGAWDLTKTIKGSQVCNFTEYTFGFTTLMVDKNFVVISAPSRFGGEVFYLERINGDWLITTRVIGSSAHKYFGLNLAKNDYDIIVQSAHQLIYKYVLVVIPPCLQPMKYKCQDVTVDTCQTEIDIPYEQLYTVGDSCTDVDLKNVHISREVSTYTFKFSRAYSDTFYCNATVTCLNPPTAAPPSNVEPPLSAGPLSSPVATVVQRPAPVSAPSEAGKTSDSNHEHTSLIVASFGGIVALLF